MLGARRAAARLVSSAGSKLLLLANTRAQWRERLPRRASQPRLLLPRLPESTARTYIRAGARHAWPATCRTSLVYRSACTMDGCMGTHELVLSLGSVDRPATVDFSARHRRPFHHVLLDRAPRLAPFLGLFSWEKILDFATIIFLFLFYKYYLIIN